MHPVCTENSRESTLVVCRTEIKSVRVMKLVPRWESMMSSIIAVRHDGIVLQIVSLEPYGIEATAFLVNCIRSCRHKVPLRFFEAARSCFGQEWNYTPMRRDT